MRVDISHEWETEQQFGLHDLPAFVNLLDLVENVLPVCFLLDHLPDEVPVGESTVFEVFTFFLLKGKFNLIQFLLIAFC